MIAKLPTLTLLIVILCFNYILLQTTVNKILIFFHLLQEYIQLLQSFCEESFVLLWTNRTKCVMQKSPPRKSQPFLNSCCKQENAAHILRRLSSVCACNRAKIAKKERSACRNAPACRKRSPIGCLFLVISPHMQ